MGFRCEDLISFNSAINVCGFGGVWAVGALLLDATAPGMWWSTVGIFVGFHLKTTWKTGGNVAGYRKPFISSSNQKKQRG